MLKFQYKKLFIVTLCPQCKNTRLNQYDVLERETLSLGVQSLKNIYQVDLLNPMVISKWIF